MPGPSHAPNVMARARSGAPSTSMCIPDYSTSEDDEEDAVPMVHTPLPLIDTTNAQNCNWTSFPEMSYYIRVAELLAEPYVEGSRVFNL